jgi:alpha/beta superfamily hydrolase
MKTRIYPLILLSSLILCSCLKLDSFLYNNNSNPISEYLLQDYDGPVHFSLPDSMKLSSDMIHLFQLESDDNGDIKKIWAVYLGDISKINSDTVILYCHGNKDHMDFYYPRAQLLAWAGGKHHYGVMMFDYRGYGLSEGTPTESGLYADTEAAMLWLKNNGLTGDRLVIYGFSMGTAPATRLTADTSYLRPSKLILEAPFASAEVFVQDGTGLAIPGSYIVELEIDNAEKIKTIEQPFLWLHGIKDTFISMYTHGNIVFANYQGEKGYACRVPEADHSDCPVFLGFQYYCQIIDLFIRDQLEYGNLIDEQ